MRIHDPQPQRDRNAGESHQYQLLRHETTALYGGNIVTVQGGCSVQEFRFALSEQIRRQIFYVNLEQNIETHIKSKLVIKALEYLCFGEMA